MRARARWLARIIPHPWPLSQGERGEILIPSPSPPPLVPPKGGKWERGATGGKWARGENLTPSLSDSAAGDASVSDANTRTLRTSRPRTQARL